MQNLGPRASGILCHPTSLPGDFGIGDLGPQAYRWIDTLALAQQSWWQILPLGPTGAGHSPYQSFSAFAGSIALLSPELLQRDGLLSSREVESLRRPQQPGQPVSYADVLPQKAEMLRAAWGRLQAQSALAARFEAFCERERSWLDDYALFQAIREGLGGASLRTWPTDLQRRDPVALGAIEQAQSDEVQMHRFGQFLFEEQWQALRAYSHSRGVRILGDVPIFVAADSADVWSQPGEFLLNDDLSPSVVAGVPPDYFAVDGQLWGNPIYDWGKMQANGYSWWLARLERTLRHVDAVRLDHFRGFAQAYHIPATAKTARPEEGAVWVDGPGADFLAAVQSRLGQLPILAEDLGLITPDVEALRLQFQLPGMRVIQFMLGAPDNLHWPHNYEKNSVCYTGTHDNDTTVGWYQHLHESDRQRLAHYLARPVHDPAHDFMRLAWLTVAQLAIAPVQDWLRLGREARMNQPGEGTGWWSWRFHPSQFPAGASEWLADLTIISNRVPSRAIPSSTPSQPQSLGSPKRML